MLDIYFNEERLEETRINVEVEEIEDFILEIASVIKGAINRVAVQYVSETQQEKFTIDVKEFLIAILSAEQGTDLKGFKKSLGLSEEI